MRKIIVCLGPCCSGKTTYSLEYIKEHPEFIRFSMDEFMQMCFGKQSKDEIQESFIKIINNLIANMCVIKENVIVDGYFLNLDSLRLVCGTAREAEIRLFDISLSEAMVRNQVRKKIGGHYVKPEELRRFHEYYKKFISSDEFYNRFVNTQRYNVISNEPSVCNMATQYQLIYD